MSCRGSAPRARTRRRRTPTPPLISSSKYPCTENGTDGRAAAIRGLRPNCYRALVVYEDLRGILRHERFPLRPPHAAQGSRLHHRRRPDAGARHRRQHRDLLAHRPGAAADAAGEGRRSSSSSSTARARSAAGRSTTAPSPIRCIATSATRTPCSTASLARFPTPLTLLANGQAERVNGELVSGNYFDVLGVRAQHRPHLHAGRRPDAGRTSGRGAQPQLLDAALRRRSVGAQPHHLAQRPADDHRRRRAGRLLRHRRRREPRRDGAGDDEGADDADLGRSAEPHQPLADDHGAAQAGRPAGAGGSGDERPVSPDQRAGAGAAHQRVAAVSRSLSRQASLPASRPERASRICASSSRRRSWC